MPSRMLKIGFQKTPVDSIATWVTPCSASQSDRASRSPVMVAEGLDPLAGLGPWVRPQRTQATTVLLWTSSPAQ